MVFLFKLLVTPILIGAVTLAGRRWGPIVSGLLMGLPLTSGPISFILARENGLAFASHAATGNLAGQVSVCIFCLVYSLVAQKSGWRVSVLASIAAFIMVVAIWNQFSLQLLPVFIVSLIGISLVSRLIPHHALSPHGSVHPNWDLPARMFLAASFVILLTPFSNLLGPQLSGLLSPFPIFGVVLAAFTHAQQGPKAASTLLRGVVLGSVSYAVFFLVVGIWLTGAGILWTYLIASLVAIVSSGIFYFITKKEVPSATRG